MEDNQNIRTLFAKYLDNTISKAELAILLQHLGAQEDNETVRLLITEALTTDPNKYDKGRLEQAVDSVALRLREKLQPRRSLKLRRYLPYAAAILLVAVSISYYVFKRTEVKDGQQIAVTDVQPGRNAATLTLANGKKILLNDASTGAIASLQGIRVSKTKDGKLIYTITETDGSLTNSTNTLSTTNGETYQIVLSDGTKVWLNAASALQYSANLGERGMRKVKLLAGEAYFEVAKDKKRPFIVETPTQKVEVLGTQFNINSYADEGATTTTLAEGSVKVAALDSKLRSTAILRPGEQSVLGKGMFKVQEADLQTALAWKDGKIYFRDAPIQEVLRQVGRWYNIQIEYEGEPTKEVFNGGIKRTASLASVLRILELSNVEFELIKKNNNIILKVTPTK